MGQTHEMRNKALITAYSELILKQRRNNRREYAQNKGNQKAEHRDNSVWHICIKDYLITILGPHGQNDLKIKIYTDHRCDDSYDDQRKVLISDRIKENVIFTKETRHRRNTSHRQH